MSASWNAELKKVLNERGSQVMREREVRIIFWKNEEGGAGINQQKGGEEERDRESETSIALL